MIKSKMITLSTTLIIGLSACADMQENPKQSLGTLLGAGLGALAGAQVGSGKGQMAAIAVGTLAGAWGGSEIGKSLDKADKLFAARTAQDSLENNKVGEVSSWSNPDTGHSGTVTPTKTYQTSSNQYCREFETTIFVEGKQEVGRGQACRTADGTWEIVR
ncbi:MAG: hypothetical protein CFH06_01893 [Alphaproteobacteria bacterium MarineAlpha3_Bin5]|nr:hypothetical protein [Magnetovibrio sp.]PPR75789.1 MAG: hypothetical protein CFH06_01893 [Alphaproteobacteria bacterium MarineAlpha3_Bin5]